jgi:hypothetical protein
MFGLIILICIATVFGFCLAWICGMVANAEIEVKTGVLIVILALIASVAASVGLNQGVGAPQWVASLGGTVVGWLALSALLVHQARITWDRGMIVAAIYAGVQFVGLMMVGAIFSS